MKTKSIIIMVSVVCLFLVAGCAGKNKSQIRKKLMAMSDKELVSYYEMLEIRMYDIDRVREESLEQNRDMNTSRHPETVFNHLEHLHIGDSWSALKKEQRLVLIETRKRGISPQTRRE